MHCEASRILIPLALILALALPRPAHGEGERWVHVLHADSRGVSLEIDAGSPVVAPMPDAPEFSGLRLAGFEPAGAEGTPALPCRAFWVGVPEGVTVRVEATALASRSLAGIRLAPRVREIESGDDA